MNLKPFAKTAAAVLTPLVVGLVVAGLKWIGVDMEVDPVSVEVIITGALSALLVFLVPNQPPT